MAYKDRYGITQIRDTKANNLSISWDYQNDINDLSQREVVFLYTPWMEDTKEHYHIPLDLEQTKVLRDWLDSFIKEVDGNQ